MIFTNFQSHVNGINIEPCSNKNTTFQKLEIVANQICQGNYMLDNRQHEIKKMKSLNTTKVTAFSIYMEALALKFSGNL